MSKLFALTFAALLALTGVAAQQSDASYALGGVFREDRTDADFADFRKTTSGHDVAIMESFPEQFAIHGLSLEECKRLHEVLDDKPYLHDVKDCRAHTASDPGTKPDEPAHDPGHDEKPEDPDDKRDERPDRMDDKVAPSDERPCTQGDAHCDGPCKPATDAATAERCQRPLKHIHFERTAHGLANYTVDGVLVFERLTLRGASGEAMWHRDGNHLVLKVGEDRLRLTDNPTGLVEFRGRGDGTFVMDFPNVTFESRAPGDSSGTGSADHDSIRVMGEDFDGFLVAEGLERAEGHILRTDDAAKFHLRPVDDDDDEDDEERDRKDKVREAIEKRKVAGEIKIRKVIRDADTAIVTDDEVVLVYDDVNVTIQRGAEDSDEPLKIIFDADLDSGRTFVLDVDPALLRGELALRYWDIHEDGNETEVVFRMADSLEDILDPDDDGGQPEYWIVRDANGLQVMVSVPHWSVHAVTLQSIGEFVLQPSVIVGVLAGVGGVVIASVAMFWPRRVD